MTKRPVDAAGDPGKPSPDSLPRVPQRIAGPAELLQAVPYLLGFHPARSLVLVGLRNGMLVVTARLDLPATGHGPVDSLVAGALDSMCDGGTTEVIAAVYDDEQPAACGDDDRSFPSSELADRIAQLADTLPCRLLDVLLVVGDRWWSYGCDSLDCCPAAGQRVPDAPTAFTTHATVAGVVPLADRAALAASLDPLPDPERHALHRLLAQVENDAVAATLAAGSVRHERAVKRALFAAARASGQARWQPPDDTEAARFAAALTATPMRDSLWLAIDSRRIDGRALWRELARRAPVPYDAAPLFLFGWASWRAGDGALAGIAADRAIDSDPDYSAADLLLAALSQGVDPRRFPRLSRSA